MPVYEFQMGIFVQADGIDEAWEKVQKRLIPIMEKLDYEKEPTIEFVESYTEGDFEE
jgi:hypothetical protein